MGSLYIAGSLNMDVVAFAPRLPRPGETLPGSRVGFFPGGKGLNPAVAAARQETVVRLIGCLGVDGFGDELHAFAQTNGIDLQHLKRSDAAASGTAIIMVADDGENSIVVIPGTNALTRPEDVAEPRYDPSDVLLTLFEIPLQTGRTFLEQGKAAGARTVLCPSPAAEFDFIDLPDVLVLNETELAFYLGATESDLDSAAVESAAAQLRRRPDQSIVVTLGSKGTVAVTSESAIRVLGRPVEAVDTTGAGDCFVGCLAARLVERDTLEDAIRYANVAASISVTRAGAAPSMPTRTEVLAVLRAGEA